MALLLFQCIKINLLCDKKTPLSYDSKRILYIFVMRVEEGNILWGSQFISAKRLVLEEWPKGYSKHINAKKG
jgi:hypothetical protein